MRKPHDTRSKQCPASFKTPDSHYWHCQYRGPAKALEIHLEASRHKPVHHHGAIAWRGSANQDRRSCGSALCPGGSRAGQAPKRDAAGVLQLDELDEVVLHG